MFNVRIVTSLLSLLVGIAAAGEKFHFTLSEDELSHYFGTTLLEEVPDYEFIPVQFIKEEVTPESRNITLKAFGQEYRLYLTENKNLLSPDCKITQLYSNGSKESVPCSNTNDSCHYLGRSESHPGSVVALSTCDGLHGVISATDHDLYIQPMLKIHKRSSSHPGKHLAIKRSAERETIASDEQRRIIRRSARRYLETKVVVAPDSHKFHGSDTTRFVTTVMNMAARIFLDPSLGDSKLYLAMVEIKILHDRSDLKIVADSGDLLNAFCQWQKKHDPPDQADPKYPDVSILITKTDLMKNGDKMNVGLGTMSGVCYTDRKCTVNQDSGLDTAYTIVHELGHALGMKHDGDSNQCTPNKYIMSPYGSTSSDNARWSTCSAQYLRDYLSGVQCLSDIPSRSETTVRLYDNTGEKPGIIYSADAQCSLFFGGTTKSCVKKTHPCRADCINPNTHQCTIVAASFADGTECGGRNWCINGQCVSMGRSGPRAVDGGWSSWDSEWSGCSRSCGGGVTLKKRTCTNPEPRFGGRECPEKSYQAKLCNLQPCVTSQHNFKEEQCSATDKNPVHGKSYHFVPFTESESDCKLTCRATNDNLVYTRAEASEDGTMCRAAGAAFASRCVKGTCEGFGCDGVLGSKAKFDNCGLCNGAGNTCTGHTGKYNENHPGGYQAVLTLPVGSTGITIQNKNGFCFMGVKINGRSIFGQNKQKALSGTYGGSRVLIEYQATPEKIHIIGPTTASVQIEVYQKYDATQYMGVAPDITYSYYTPHGGASSHDFKWAVVTSQCSATCGTGKQSRTAKCIRISNNAQVEDFNCDLFLKPSEIPVYCNIQACPPEWHAFSWDTCSKECGGGTRTRKVQCVTIQRGNLTAVSESRCNAARKPAISEACNTQACEVTGACLDKLDCRAYGNQVCSNYPEWTQLNCPKHCHLCPEGKPCEDLEDCPAYGDNVCKEYKDWAQVNCRKHCGFCSSAGNVNAGSCSDKVNCDDYQDDICTNPTYAKWSKENCPNWCKLCTQSTTSSPHSQTNTGNTNTHSTNDHCQDKVTCSEYGGDVCTAYKPWAHQNCARHCKFCQPCSDVLPDCADYGKSACTGDYEKWARENCQSYCNYCDAVNATTSTIATHQGTPHHETSSNGNHVQSSSSNTASSDPCRDVEKCNEYGDDICTNYETWARQNCARHCKFCEPCKDALSDCAAYGKTSCSGVYEPWARENCKLFCNYCGDDSSTTTHRTTKMVTTTPRATTVSTTHVASTDPCKDIERCDEYGSDVCTAYASWSKINCRRHCKFCQPCKDAITDCADYGRQACKGDYIPWAKNNCKLYCNFCDTDSATTTTTTTTSTTTTTPPPTTVVVSSDPCRDKIEDCDEYGDDVCTAYGQWAKTNCQRHCKFCQPCTDKLPDCAGYGRSACSGQYLPWARKNCPHYCNLCGSRKKRDVWRAGMNAPKKINTETRNSADVKGSNAADPLEMDLMHANDRKENILIPNKISDNNDLKAPEMVVESQNLVPSRVHRIPQIVKLNSVGDVPNEGGGYNLQPVEEYSEGRVPAETNGSEKGQVPPGEEVSVLDEVQKLENLVDDNIKM